MCEDLPVIWAIPEFIEAKKDIVDRICELSGIESILADKLVKEEEEAKQLAALQKEEDEAEAHEENENLIKKALAETPGIELSQLESDVTAALN
jgi:hypothetical protein